MFSESTRPSVFHLSEQLSCECVNPEDLIGWGGDEQVRQCRGGETHIQGRVQRCALNIQNAHINPEQLWHTERNAI